MDFLDEVLTFDEKAFEEGYKRGRQIAQEVISKESFDEGFKNGKNIAKEVSMIKSYSNTLQSTNQRVQKVQQEIAQLEVNSQQSPEAIKEAVYKLRSLYKHLVSLLKVHTTIVTDPELY